MKYNFDSTSRVQFVFVVFSTIEESNKGDYLFFILVSLCKLLQRHPSLDTPSSQFAAKAITHVARNSP